jgi:hypothetical protein
MASHHNAGPRAPRRRAYLSAADELLEDELPPPELLELPLDVEELLAEEDDELEDEDDEELLEGIERPDELLD